MEIKKVMRLISIEKLDDCHIFSILSMELLNFFRFSYKRNIHNYFSGKNVISVLDVYLK